MKKLLLIALVALSVNLNAGAQNLNWFDFASNNGRLEAGLNVGKSGWTTTYEAWALGVDLVVYGVQLSFIQAGPEHKYDHHITDTQWNDKVACTINVGYQIPVLPWVRIVPTLGYCQTNDGVTDGSSVNISWDEGSGTMYHDYKVTPGSRTHHFNYGAGLSIQPLKWFSINGTFSRYAIYGGFTLDLVALATAF